MTDLHDNELSMSAVAAEGEAAYFEHHGIRYPDITVTLTGGDGNVFAIIGAVQRELRRAGVPAEEVTEFAEAAFACGSYDEVLQLVMRTVDVN